MNAATKAETKRVGICAAFGLVCFLGGTFGGNALFIEEHAKSCRAEFEGSVFPERYVEQNMTALCPDVKTGALLMALSGTAGGALGVGLGALLTRRKSKAPAP